jgi:predicted ester cyclase
VSIEQNQELVHRLVDAVNRRDESLLDEVAAGPFAELARRWVMPFRGAFPDFHMQVVRVVAEADTVVAHFRCSGTHEGAWLDIAPTGRRFEDVDEIYIFRVRRGRIVSAVGVEDNLSRLRQLGIALTPE